MACKYCGWVTKEKMEQCLERSPKGYLCTLPKGHEEEHIACGEKNGQHIIRDKWNNED